MSANLPTKLKNSDFAPLDIEVGGLELETQGGYPIGPHLPLDWDYGGCCRKLSFAEYQL
jgi:hypothetical protein